MAVWSCLWFISVVKVTRIERVEDDLIGLFVRLGNKVFLQGSRYGSKQGEFNGTTRFYLSSDVLNVPFDHLPCPVEHVVSEKVCRDRNSFGHVNTGHLRHQGGGKPTSIC